MEKSLNEILLERKVLELEKIIIGTKIEAIQLKAMLESSIWVTGRMRETVETIIEHASLGDNQ